MKIKWIPSASLLSTLGCFFLAVWLFIIACPADSAPGGNTAALSIAVQERAPKASVEVAQGTQLRPDRLIGQVTVNVRQVFENKALIEPLMAPSFVILKLSGEGQAPTVKNIMTCDVILRELGTIEQTVISLTVLRCGGMEYAVQSVEFVVNK